jgi:hypothetical protein
VRWRTIEEWIRKAHGRVIMIENEIHRIEQIGRSRKQNEDGVYSRKVEAGIEESCERWMRDRGMSMNIEESRKVDECISGG